MPKYTEDDLQNAIRDVIGGSSQARASQRWGVPRSTIQQRLKGRTSRKEAFEPLQKLPMAQESRLVSWILIQNAIGDPPSHEQVRKIASTLAENNGCQQPIGKRLDFQRIIDAARRRACQLPQGGP